LQEYDWDALHPIWKLPGGISTISIPVRMSRTRHARPVAVIALRSVAFVTMAGSGFCSSSVAQDGMVKAT
jgi:hypothetical protein